jgi:hypothetical protein
MSEDLTSYRRDKTYEERRKDYLRIIAKNPTYIPVIIEVADKSGLKLKKHKYLTQYDLCIGQFMMIVRKSATNLLPEEALFMFPDTRDIPRVTDSIGHVNREVQTYYNSQMMLMGDLDEEEKRKKLDYDGFLYLTFQKESTFGF